MPQKDRKKFVKTTCLAEAQQFADAVQLVLASGKLLDLIDAFEKEDKQGFRAILDGIPGIATEIKDKMDQQAHTNETVTFKWY